MSHLPKLVAPAKPLNANWMAEVHVGWCPPGTSNPTGLPMVDRSVRFRLTSAKASGSFDMASKRKLKPFRAAKEVKRRARLLVGAPPPVRREESPKLRPPKHQKRELEKEKELL